MQLTNLDHNSFYVSASLIVKIEGRDSYARNGGSYVTTTDGHCLSVMESPGCVEGRRIQELKEIHVLPQVRQEG